MNKSYSNQWESEILLVAVSYRNIQLAKYNIMNVSECIGMHSGCDSTAVCSIFCQDDSYVLFCMVQIGFLQIQTSNNNNYFDWMTNCLHFKRLLLLLAAIVLTTPTGTINNIQLDSYNVNAVANYTWNVIFNNATNRASVDLTFPTQCVLSASTAAYIGATPLSYSYNANVLTVNSSLLSGTVSIIVRNVKNPNSAITTSAFSAISSIDPQFSYGSIVSYTTGLLQSSTWSFSLCTEQPSSVLTINVMTTNVIPSGNSVFEVGYGAWANHYNKNLLTGVTTLNAQVSINGGVNTSVSNIAYDTNSQKITINYTLSGELPGSSNLTFIISGVQSPPTQTTPANSSFRVATADGLGTRIDEKTSVTILPTCVLNITTGIFGYTAMEVNSNYPSSLRILYAETPIITFQATDTFEVHYNYLSSLSGCTRFDFWRNNSKDTILSTMNQSTSSYYQYVPTSSNYNTDYSLNITLNLICSSIMIPPSETPVVLTFKFKRNGAQYLQLSATMSPTAAAIPASNAALTLSNYQMATAAVTFTYSVLTSQPLTANPALKISITNNVLLTATPTCIVTISAGILTNQSCAYNNSTRILTVYLNANSAVISGTNISVAVSPFTNPSSLITDVSGIQTYYDSSVSSSRVEASTTVFSVTFGGITNYNTTFAPSNMTVYTNTQTTITFTTRISIPSGSSIYVEFPAAASNITFSSTPLSVNSSVASTTAVNNNNNSFTLTTIADIGVNSIVVITSGILTPSTMNSFTYVILRIKKNGVLYIESANSMVLNVNSVVNIPVTITPSNPKTGVVSAYTIVLTLNVPHPSNFYIQIDLPSDVSFSSSGADCTGNCSLALAGNATSLIINSSNSLPSSTGQLITLNLGATFTNPRSIGNAAAWIITTKSISPSNTITISASAPQISAANLLTATMKVGDPYYINNTSPVRVTLSFTNSLISGDYILMTINSGVYTENTGVNCSTIYGVCSKVSGSSPGTLGIKIQPNLTYIINKTLNIVIEGLISGKSIAQNVTVSTYNSSMSMIDSGLMLYQLSCKDSASLSILNNCRTCQSNGDCIDCYTSSGFYLNATACVTSCGLANSYLSYDNNVSGVCTPCSNNCFTCTAATVCIACLKGYYFIQGNSSCLSTCTASGYIPVTDNFGTLICKPCYGNGTCLQCTSNLAGTCTLCISSAVLSNGICSANCSTTKMYASGGVCYNCDASCENCTSSGNGGCIRCALGFYNYTNYCVKTCPTDTAPSSTSGVCTCDSPCSKCLNSTTYCTACTDTSLFVYQGSCVGSCPSASYLNGFTCVSCSTACTSCTITTCMTCLTNYYLYNNLCFSDCNQVGQQYDASGSTCVMCPDGCDTCLRATCYSCLPEYTLTSSTSQCVKTCLLTNSCQISASQVIPLPGLISAFVWAIIVVIIKLVLQKSYVPYSVIIGSSVIEFVLVIATLSNAGDVFSSLRLLSASSLERLTVRGLMGGALAINYITNIIYIFLFIKYIKPLISNPRQIDVIANVVVLVFGTVTNYRFALIAFSKMFPKPYVYVQNGSKLTPIHYLAIGSLILEIIPLSGCIIAVMNEQPLSNLFMLGLDLLIVIILNIFVTIWFVACKKPDEYFDSDIKKYHIEEHNATNQNIQNTLQNEKNLSKAKIVHNETYNFEEDDFTDGKQDDLNSNYKKMDGKIPKSNIKTVKHAESIVKKVSPSHINISNDEEKISEDSDLNLEIKSISVVPKNRNIATKDTPQNDVNFQQGLKSKHGSKSTAKMSTREMPKLNQSFKSDGKSVEEGLSNKKKSQPQNFSKQALVTSARKNYNRPEKDIEEVQEDLDFGKEHNQPNNESVFQRQKEKLTKPYRAGDKKPTLKPKKESKGKQLEEPMKIMKKQQKIGYFDTDAFQSNAEQDIESIIKQKVWQSAIKHQKQRQTDNEPPREQESAHSDTGYQQISPSWFNVQNQRIDLSDFGQNESEP